MPARQPQSSGAGPNGKCTFCNRRRQPVLSDPLRRLWTDLRGIRHLAAVWSLQRAQKQSRLYLQTAGAARSDTRALGVSGGCCRSTAMFRHLHVLVLTGTGGSHPGLLRTKVGDGIDAAPYPGDEVVSMRTASVGKTRVHGGKQYR